MQQTSCPVAPNRPFVEFARADHSATCGRFYVFRVWTGIKHYCEKTYLFPSQFANRRKIRFEDQPSAAFPTLLQWVVSVKAPDAGCQRLSRRRQFKFCSPIRPERVSFFLWLCGFSGPDDPRGLPFWRGIRTCGLS